LERRISGIQDTDGEGKEELAAVGFLNGMNEEGILPPEWRSSVEMLSQPERA